MFNLSDIASFVIQQISNSSINVRNAKGDIEKLILGEAPKNSDIIDTVHHLKRATHILDIIVNKPPHIKILDLKSANKKHVIQTNNIQISTLLFKLPNIPLCYINKYIVDVLKYAIQRHPKIKFNISFKFSRGQYITILRFPKQSDIYKYAKANKINTKYDKGYTWVYM